MEYLGIVFGIFGLMAYLQQSSLKSRIDGLERQLAKLEGTDCYEDRQSLARLAASCIGHRVSLTMKEDHGDVDIMMYGNTKHGSNTILDADGDWLLLRVDGPKGPTDKLIRLESVQAIAEAKE
jgi:hypothetical protein